MASALIALGSNLGDRQRILDGAVAALAAQPGIRVVRKSGWHATPPVGGPPGQGEFLNGAALLDTALSPVQLHAVLKQIELAAGRTSGERWAPRTLDLDLLLYDKLLINTPELTVPHPRMAFRRFVLEPAAEIAPAMKHPIIAWSLAALRDHMRGDWFLNRRGIRYFAAITGPLAAGKSTLATAVAAAIGAKTTTDAAASRSPQVTAAPRADQKLSEQMKLAAHRTRQLSTLALVRRGSDTISDFWLEQSYCDAELALPSHAFTEFVNQCRPGFEKAVKPMLLVFLDVSPDVSWLRIAQRGAAIPHWIDHDWLVRYRDLLIARTMAPKRGPLLRLDGTKPDEARDELIAAIQAMM